jgi:hypothetical protein
MENVAGTSSENAGSPYRRLAAGLFLPPTIWAIQFQGLYTFVRNACHSPHPEIIPITTAVSLLLIVAVAGMSVGSWRRWRKTEHDGSALMRFLSAIAVASAALFGLLVLVQGLAYFFVDRCQT